MSPVQNYAKNIIVDELKKKLGTEVGIGKLSFHPFNTIALDSVYLYDQSGERVLLANRISADIDILALTSNQLIFTSAKLSDFDIRLSKETSNSPLNIQYVIDAFKSDNKESKSKLEIKLNSVSISNGEFRYDVKDKEKKEDKFDANHIHVSDFNARLALKSLVTDSLNVQIKKLNLKEQSGLEISNLTCRLLTHGKQVSVRGFRLDMPSSTLTLDKCEINTAIIDSSMNVMENAMIDCVISPSHIAPKDLTAFIPSLKNFNDVVTIKAHISGTIDDINVDDLTLDYGEKMHLVTHTEIHDIRYRDKMYILGSIEDLTITTDGIEGLANNLSNKKANLPKQIANLGTISFQGDVSGYLDQLTAFGSFETKLGIVKTDILFRLKHQKWIDYYLQGKVYTSDFNLGELLGNTRFNKTSLDINISMEKTTHGNMKGKAEGTIFNFDYNNYSYKDITLDANYDGKRADGHVNLNDPNGILDIDGILDLSDKNKPELDFTARIKDVQLDELHLVDKFKNSYLSLVVNANFKGKTPDDIVGAVSIDSIDFIRGDKLFFLPKLSITSAITDSIRKLTIDSDIIKGEVSGAYNFATMVKSIKHTLHPYLPAVIPDNKDANEEIEDIDLKFNLQVNNSESLSNILELPVTNYSPAKIFGDYNSSRNKFKIEAYVPAIKAAGMNMKSVYLSAENKEENISSKINALIAGKKNVMNDIGIDIIASNNSINTNITFSNDAKQRAKGVFDITTLLSKKDKDAPLRIDMDILPSELILNNAIWKMDKSHIAMEAGTIGIDNLRIHTEKGDQEIKVNGRFSPKNPQEILKAELKNIDLEYIFQTLAIDVLKFGGAATGNIFVSSIEQKPYANTRLEITDFKFNGTDLGYLNIFSELDDETNMVMLEGTILSKENKNTNVKGSIDPIKQKLSIHFDADSIDVSFLNAYTSSVFNKVQGRGTGNVHLHGNFSNVTVEGKAYIEKGLVGISFLNTDYMFSDTVYMKLNPGSDIGLIYFNDVAFSDQNNNKAIISGKVVHDYFRDFLYHIDLSAQNFMVYNATEKQNPIFYGTVFGSGNGTIGGDEKSVDIRISMRTEENTLVRMNFMEDVVNEYSFITYKDPKSNILNDTVSQAQKRLIATSPLKTESGMEINMDFYIDATPNATLEILMDPVGGDVLRGSGSGAMQFVWGSNTSPKLYGNYFINRGSYNFTFQRIMERKFSIQDGSSVQFRGDPFEATLDVTALYKVTANLNDLDRQLAQRTGQANIPVNCVLNLTGALKHPNVALDVQFPASDPEVQRQIKSLINTEDMINRQVAYLLILSKFYTPQYADVDRQTSDFAAVASATLSNQLSKIISQIDDRWELGTSIRYSDADQLSSTEVEVMLSSHLLNDKLIINGNFGYRDNPMLNQEAFIGDIDLELLLNNSGSWRIKAYNHYNEKYYYTQTATQTQGVGLIYKRDFDNVNELFIRQPKKDKQAQDTITPILPDSTKKGSALSNFIRLKK